MINQINFSGLFFLTIDYLFILFVLVWTLNVFLFHVRHYDVSYKYIVKAADFGKHKVCFKQLVMQPRPMVLFTWDGWFQDMPCTFKVSTVLYVVR